MGAGGGSTSARTQSRGLSFPCSTEVLGLLLGLRVTSRKGGALRIREALFPESFLVLSPPCSGEEAAVLTHGAGQVSISVASDSPLCAGSVSLRG